MFLPLLIVASASAVRIAPPPNVQFAADILLGPHYVRGQLRAPDPKYNITCLGARSDLPWDLWSTNYNGQSMQKLCAQEPWGGRDRHSDEMGLNLGGYCESHDVAFQFGAWSLGGRYGTELLRYQRAFLECRSRCFCNHNLPDPEAQPKVLPITRKTFSGPLLDPYESENRRAPTIPVDRKAAPASWTRPDSVTRILMNDNRQSPQGSDVGILSANMIQCGGSLPEFALPGPWSVEEFENNQELCAVQLSGGKPAANAGGYCYRDGTAGKTVAFADDMTPRWDWTWSSYGTFFGVASLRFHCWKNCLCAQPSKKPNYKDPQIPMWDFVLSSVPKDTLAVTKNNRNPLGSSTDAKGRIMTTSTASGSNQPSAQCAADPKHPGTCAIPWPTDMMGPVPGSVAKLALPKPPPLDWNQTKQCGNRCDSNSDCGGDCLCRVPSTEEAHSLGVDPVSIVALCINFASVFG